MESGIQKGLNQNTELSLKTEDGFLDTDKCNPVLILKTEEDEFQSIGEYDTKPNLKTETEYEDLEEFNAKPFLKTGDDSQSPSRTHSGIHSEFLVDSDKSLSSQDSSAETVDGVTGKHQADLSFDIKTEVEAVAPIGTESGSKVTSPGKSKEAKGFECDVCGKKVSRNWDLKIHRRIHTGERPYACSYCDLSFISNSHRKRHEIIHTKGNKPFKCEQCIRSFHSRSELEEHDFSHTGISKHCCDECGSYFSNSSALKTHVTRVHDTPRSLPHNRASRLTRDSLLACEKCGQLFKKKKKYDEHCNLHCYYKALEAIREQKLALKKEPT